jgi:hypothetical protein
VSEIDFSKIPTDQLRHETLERASKVSDYNDPVWDSAIYAIFGSAGAFWAIVIGLIAPVKTPFTIALECILVAIGIYLSVPWFVASHNCSKYRDEMRARREELERRNRSA